MTQHTKLPWTLGKGAVRLRTEDGTLVAECYTTGNYIRYPKKSEREANAAFIVKACNNHDPLTKAAQKLLHLHLCEMEGIESGQPTPDQWAEAVDELSQILED